ncbi:MAG: tRNA (adenosine(37)-N6)-dimethylallyltransferase MiaA [Bacteroidales bacterium]|jgi:tRNA dimethylallyltransferase|nr:tRNA (adenosine(37)-N6)-dimethylallyltransferase MiaA [Bacteroidales bacterium]
MKRKLVTILGPTATGKTKVAVALAQRLDGEIVSADSRQLYRRMDIGTGKDLDDYTVEGGQQIKYHLLDCVEPGIEYNVFRYQQAAKKALADIEARNRQPILCGGSGMYIEALLSGYKLFPVPENPDLRTQWETQSDEALIAQLEKMRVLHNHTDSCERTRLLRALEIEHYYQQHPELEAAAKPVPSIVFGLHGDRNIIRSRITQRLHARLAQGMIEEVQQLMNNSVNPNQLIRYGLEYKFITLYLQGQISYELMVQRLNVAIHQFSKRQMTWFRKMERAGCQIHWLDIALSTEEILQKILSRIDKQ